MIGRSVFELSWNDRGGAGIPLPGELRRAMEAALGAPLDHVRLHADEAADRACAALDAGAFTIGEEIFFRRGCFDLASPGGLTLLAHELVHTVQNTAFAANEPFRLPLASRERDASEQEAAMLAPLVARGVPVRVTASPSAWLQRASTVQALKLRLPAVLYNNWRSFINLNQGTLNTVYNLYEDVFPEPTRNSLTDNIVNQNLGGALLDTLMLTPKQLREIYAGLRKISPQIGLGTALTNAEILTLLTRCCGPAAVAPAAFHTLATTISRPRFLLGIANTSWQNPFTNAHETGIVCLARAAAAMPAANLCNVLNRAIHMMVQGGGVGDFTRICNLLALIPDTPANIETRVLDFLGTAGPTGGWQNLLNLANDFVLSGRKRAAAGPSRFQSTGIGGGARLQQIFFHPDDHVDALSMVAMFETDAAEKDRIQDQLNTTISLWESRVLHVCNSHTMRHCNFMQRMGVQAQNFDFFPRATNEGDILNIGADLFTNHTAALQTSAIHNPCNTVGNHYINNLEAGLYDRNGDGTKIQVDHLMPTAGYAGFVRISKELLGRIQHLFDLTSNDPSGR